MCKNNELKWKKDGIATEMDIPYGDYAIREGIYYSIDTFSPDTKIVPQGVGVGLRQLRITAKSWQLS